MILSLNHFTASPPAKGSKQRTPANPIRTDSELDSNLLDLVRLRVVQVLRHKQSVREQTRKLKAQGESNRRLRLLKDWRKRTVFNDHEEAALNLAEALTRDPIGSVPEDVVHSTRLFFDEGQTVHLILAILAVNDWHYLNLPPIRETTCRRYCE